MQRFKADSPCPICGGFDSAKRGQSKRCYGYLSEDGNWAHCTREEHSGGLAQHPNSNTFAHRMNGPCKCGDEHGSAPIISPPLPPAQPRSTTTSTPSNGPTRSGTQGKQAGQPGKAAKKSAGAGKQASARREVVARYTYKDKSGNPNCQVVRFDPKSFSQRRPAPEGNGHWIWGLTKGDYRQNDRGDWVRAAKGYTGPTQPFGTIERVIYNLPVILRNPTKTVAITEGEKDADRLVASGILATTCLGGAGKWRDEDSTHFQDRKVYIFPDNDQAGKDHASTVAAKLYGIAKSIRIVLLPGLPDKGDVSEWLDAGNTISALKDRARAAPEWKPEAPSPDDEEALRLTDLGNARAMAAKHGDEIRYCWASKSWYAWWENAHWRPSSMDVVMRLAKAIIDEMCKDALRAKESLIPKRDKEEYAKAEELERHAVKSASERGLRAMVTLTQSELGISIDPTDFDIQPHLLNCLNGTVDLRTGKLHPHDKADLLSKICPVNYDPNATSKRWDDFLSATIPDPEVHQFCQLAAGYSATGSTREEILIFCHGPAGTGKSTFLEAIGAALGTYASTADFSAFLKNRHGRTGSSADIADLADLRLVRSVEVDRGASLAEGLIKTLTGGDTVKARKLYSDHFAFKPRFTLWFAANDYPKVPNDDTGIWRRILPVPFEQKVAKGVVNKSLKELFIDPDGDDLPAILSWIVLGARLWYKSELPVPEAIDIERKKYQAEFDPIKDWCDDCCELVPDIWTSSNYLFKSYRDYCDEIGIRGEKSKQGFTKQLKHRGLQSKSRRVKGKLERGWIGITFKYEQSTPVHGEPLFP